MKQLSAFLLLMFVFMAVVQPSGVSANNSDDDHSEYEYDDDDDSDDDSDDDREDDEDRDDHDELEVEADVYTDTTVVKVELEGGSKTAFETNQTTKTAIAELVAEKFDLDYSDVLAVIEFEVEDRSSSSKEREETKEKSHSDDCLDDSLGEPEIEADIFTDTTVVKVELEGGSKKIFDTTATTSDAIVAEVVRLYDLDVDKVKSALELEIEDRASRSDDRTISSSNEDCDDNPVSGSVNSSAVKDAELRARIAELQRMLETLISLFKMRFGTSI